MIFIFFLIELSASFLEIACSVLLYASLFDSRISKKYRYIFYAGAVVFLLLIVTVFNQIQLFSYITSIFMIFLIALCGYYLFYVPFVISFSLTSLYICIIYIFDNLSFSIATVIFPYDNLVERIYTQFGIERVTAILISKGLLIAFVLTVYFLLLKRFLNVSLNRFFLILSLLGPISIYFMMELTLSSFSVSIFFSWISMVATIILLLAFYFIYQSIKKEREHNELLIQQYNTMKDSYLSNATLYHDMHHHINSIRHFIDTANIQEAQKYLDSIHGHENTTQTFCQWTDVNIVNNIIATKLTVAQKRAITFNINADLTRSMNIANADLCIILSNLLDNAIEACKKISNPKDRYIYLGIRNIKHVLIIKIKNGTQDIPHTMNGNFITTKSEKKMHGFGITSVRNSVNKYNGTLLYDFIDKQCSVIVNLYECKNISLNP